MNENLADLIREITNKQELINKYIKSNSNEILKDLSYSEMHCIDRIARIEKPNVTKIAEALNITKGGVSKIIKKLHKKGLINIYTEETNKKEIYYNLTPTGEDVFKEHSKIHKKICSKDIEFFEKIDKEKLIIIKEFLIEYNKYLDNRTI